VHISLNLSPVAKRDILDISDYYAEVSVALAERFVEELQRSLHGLTQHPDKGSRRYAHLLPDRSLRTWPLDRFPYLLFYRSHDETLKLLRVLHERRALTRKLMKH
jgi:toxin ParE1/3/4